MLKAELMLLGLVILLISTGALADEGVPEKPEDWDRQLDMLRSVPYLAFSETAIGEGDTGVVYYDPQKACAGYNFYCSKSSGEAFLMDMESRLVHRWRYSLKGAGEDRTVLLANGDIMVMVTFHELLRLNWHSQLLWKKELDVHHDLAQLPDGSFYVIVRDHKDYRGLKVKFAAIEHLTADGEEIDRWSTYDRLAEVMDVLDTRSFLDTVLDNLIVGRSPEKRVLHDVKAARGPGTFHYDYFHLNTVSLIPATPLEEKDRRFQEGNLLVCFRNVNQIAVLEKDSYRVLWAWGEGELEWPHHPTMLPNGHILIFDNGVKRKRSRVVELDPIAESIVWKYVAESPEDFYTHTGGSSQHLPNGNTLICESNEGRVFEVTREGEMAWVWLNPAAKERHNVGPRETVHRMFRLPTAQVEYLISRGWWWE
jgi:hypothetical protein